jgi:hypothetical protein
MDPRVLWEKYLWDKAKIKDTYTGYQLLRSRVGAPKAELDFIYKLLSPRLHPDKATLEAWLQEHYPDQMDHTFLLRSRTASVPSG